MTPFPLNSAVSPLSHRLGVNTGCCRNCEQLGSLCVCVCVVLAEGAGSAVEFDEVEGVSPHWLHRTTLTLLHVRVSVTCTAAVMTSVGEMKPQMC